MIEYYQLKDGQCYKIVKAKNPNYIGRKVISLKKLIDYCHGET